MKIFLAGAENEQARLTLLKIKAPFVFLSYFYLRERADTKAVLEEFKKNGITMALDSGAHTFLAGIGESKATVVTGQPIKENPDRYCWNYINWLKKYRDYFEFYVELDIDRVVGYEKIKGYRNQFVENGLQDKLMVVWHYSIPDSVNEFEKMCQGFNFVAIADEPEPGRCSMLVEIGRKYKRKVHGFAMTKPDYIRRFPFYSVDSTSWKAGSKYGITYYLMGNKIEATNDKGIRRRIMNFDYFKPYEVKWEEVLKDKNEEVDKINAITWIEYGKWLNENQQDKYWEEPIVQKQEELIVSEIKSKVLPPEETRGKIKEIRERPEVREKWLAVMKNNLFAFKTGKYSTKLPLYCNNCYAKGKCEFYQEPQKEGDKVLCALRKDIFSEWFGAEKFDYREEDTVMETKNKIISYLLQKLALQSWFEMLDGGIQDKTATMLAATVFNMLRETKVQIGGMEINVNKKIAIAINNLDEKTRRRIIESLRQFEPSK